MRLLHLPQTTSTMDVARQLVAQNDSQTQAVLADFQTHGRGRLGRIWRTFPSPHSMACTYIVREGVGEHLPLIAALAVQQAILAELPAADAKVKWPNDVLLQGKKVAGILCERQATASDSPMLVGIGLNLLHPGGGIDDTFPGTFLNSHKGPEYWANAIGDCLFTAVALYSQHGWAAFHHNYAHACVTFGQHVAWKGAAGDQDLTGLARGLNADGHLELVADDGTVHVIRSGDVVLQAQKPL